MKKNAFPDALPPQSRLHWYTFDRVLGQGGFGITYLARDANLDQPVAIKEYLPLDVATRGPQGEVRPRSEEQEDLYRWGLERFIKEARTLARFDHPNIVRVLSVFELNDTAYMVMRFEEGETLAAHLQRRQALPESELLHVLAPILNGLELVHGAGFIHRDIKPDNILIRSDGSPVLLDFGSARLTQGQSRTLTILVAPGYAPFEQYYSDGESQGPWTDIYALGATCYRVIAGRTPLDAIARSKGILGSTKEMLVPATAVGSGRYSERFLKAVDHALAFAERDRPQTIAQWRQELLGSTYVARTPTHTAPTVLSAPPAAPIHASSRGPLLWGAVGGAAVLIALAAVPWLLPRTSQEPASPRAAEPAADPSKAEAMQRIAALEKSMAEERRKSAEERERLQVALQQAEAQKKAEPPKPRSEVPKPVPREKPVVTAPPIQARTVEPEPKPAPVVVVSAPPAPAPAPSAAEMLASAERAQARGAYAEAAATFKGLADKGNARAMTRLGDLHSQGQGVERNEQEALRLYRRAAELGDSEGQLRLGDLYAMGRGVPQNNFQAYVWYSVAARAGNPSGKAQQERAAATLQTVEVEQARKLVDSLVQRMAKDR